MSSSWRRDTNFDTTQPKITRPATASTMAMTRAAPCGTMSPYPTDVAVTLLK